VPRYKSVPDDGPFGRALGGEIVDEVATVEGLTTPPLSGVSVSSRLFPYTGPDGASRNRVLAVMSHVASGGCHAG
jgi:hypothetical protein